MSGALSRRPSQVYVEISSPSVAGSGLPFTSSGKENASPITITNMPLARAASDMRDGHATASFASSSGSARKRTLSQVDVIPSKEQVKKPRPMESAALVESGATKKAGHGALENGKPNGPIADAKAKAPRKPSVNARAKGKDLDASNATEEYPNGFFYCHQCAKKRDSGVGIQCTIRDAERAVRCKTKYCRSCLKNRYGVDMDMVQAKRAEASSPKKHDLATADYEFKCPKCAGTCNCSRCRKAQGLGATGNLTTLARKTGAPSAAAMLSQDPSTVGIMPGRGRQIPKEDKPSKPRKKPGDAQPGGEATSQKHGRPKKNAASSASANTKAGVNGQEKPKRRRTKPKPKPLPTPTWTRIPTSLSLANAESRMHIREFVLRFADAMSAGKRDGLPKSALEELEILDPNGNVEDEDEDHPDGEEALVSWVSESCVKAILVGLLGILASDEDAKNEAELSSALKDIRLSGANLNKMWATLATLRSPSFSLPSPLPPPVNATVRTTRSADVAPDGGVLVANTAQFVPVIEALIAKAIHTEVIHHEIQEGLAEAENVSKDAKEGVKKEVKAFEAIPKGNGQGKEVIRVKNAHKQQVEDIERGAVIASTAYAHRTGPLGRDIDGRTYWILSPGVAERDAMLDIVKTAGSVDDARPARSTGRKLQPRVVSEEDRQTLEKWSWHVAVHGRIPNGALRAKEEDSEDEDEVEDDDEMEGWWAFWQPEEIRKLAEWIAIKGGVADEKKNKSDEGNASKKTAPPKLKAKPKTKAQDGGVSSKGKHIKREPDAEKNLARAYSDLSDLSSDILPDLSSSEDEAMSQLSELPDDVEDTGSDLSELDSDADMDTSRPGKYEIRRLAQGLREYADLLEWRVRKWGPEE